MSSTQHQDELKLDQFNILKDLASPRLKTKQLLKLKIKHCLLLE